jgi:hypothetical protein
MYIHSFKIDMYLELLGPDIGTLQRLRGLSTKHSLDFFQSKLSKASRRRSDRRKASDVPYSERKMRDSKVYFVVLRWHFLRRRLGTKFASTYTQGAN